MSGDGPPPAEPADPPAIEAPAPKPGVSSGGPTPDAWVLSVEDPRRLPAVMRVLDRGAEVTRPVPLSRAAVCVELGAPAPERLARRVARKLGADPELRLNCDVAWAPMGRGYVLLLVSQPAPNLEQELAAHHMAYHELSWPSVAADPVRLCLPRLALADPLTLADKLEAQGIGVQAVYEVGGCRRP